MSQVLEPTTGPGFLPTFEMVNSPDEHVRASQVQNLKAWLEWAQDILEQVTANESIVSVGDDITTETTFGKVPSPGTSSEAARADHTHGTPAWPTSYVGDVTMTGDLEGTTFTLSVSGLVEASIILVLRGRILKPGFDFTVSGTTLTTSIGGVAGTAPFEAGDPASLKTFDYFYILRADTAT